MGLFGRGKSGGLMNVIRCDEQEYLVWKWRPDGQDANSSSRENSIRYGSSLRVKDGEMAVFVYKQKDGSMQDFITGPYDDTIKTANFPVLSSIVGLGFGGESPFQAEIYFINLSGIIQVRFALPYFGVSDLRATDVAVPVAVGGSISFRVGDPKAFIKNNRLINFTLDDFKKQIGDAVARKVKRFVTNAPADFQIPVMQLERRVDEISDLIKERLVGELSDDFAVELRRVDISRIEVDKESEEYQILQNMTTDQQRTIVNANTSATAKNIHDMQAMNAQNMAETMRIQREEAQRAQRLQTETQFIGAHALDRQTDVLQAMASNMGNSSFGGGAGFNPGSMMAGMAVGGALGGQMAGMVNNMGQQMNAQYQQAMSPGSTPPPMPGTTPPPPSATQYTMSVNGQQYGPYSVQQMAQYAQQGSLTAETYVWAQGMPQWTPAGQVPELANLFGAPAMPGAPVPPPMPPTM